jgi:hypothetical protein
MGEHAKKEEAQDKPTVTVDCEIPEGFELQGEFRSPKEGEWFLSFTNAPMRVDSITKYTHRLILKKKPVTQEVTLKLTPPEGFRFTGEYREPKVDEWYVSIADKSQATQANESKQYIRMILEKVDA